MSDKEEDQRIRQMLDGILGASEALPSQGGIVIQGATIIRVVSDVNPNQFKELQSL
jgi:hypothetical protein